MQWLNMEWSSGANTPVISFQVKLYEATRAVQFVYRQEAGAVNNGFGGASIGLAGTGSGDFISLSDSGTHPTASTTTETTNIATKPEKGQVYTFTPRLAPTAATVSIGGRVMTASGRGIRNVSITLTDSNGDIRTAISTAFGYYRFEDVPADETYIISARAKRYQFAQPTLVLSVSEEMNDVDFAALPQQIDGAPGKQIEKSRCSDKLSSERVF